ncbi:hypothetical protein QYS36_20410 [Pseudomonas sp. G34]|uniref:hypothetical protein n=1 Tax=Pseudomonas sp. G34 TaxID=3059083 RepID=UPI002807B037|nr:hypothetical protein [Pseudomonas sp. G34]MDQ7987311.1 hypothetical protein [Pseudomonas sp. G34]
MDDRIKDLIAKLTMKTADSSLDWAKTSRDNEFICKIGNTSVTVDRYYYADEWDGSDGTIIDICILNKQGEQIDRHYSVENNSNEYSILSALHSAAHRRYHKIDDIINGLISDLDLI